MCKREVILMVVGLGAIACLVLFGGCLHVRVGGASGPPVEAYERFAREGFPVEEVLDMAQGAAERHPDAVSVMLRRHVFLRVFPDGSTERLEHLLWVPLGETHIEWSRRWSDVYDRTDETLEVLLARVIKPSGEVADVAAGVSDHVDSSNEFFDEARRVVDLYFAGAEVGDALEIIVRKTAREAIPRGCDEWFFIQEWRPVEEVVVCVDYPRGMLFHSRVLDGQLRHSSRGTGTGTRHLWWAAGIPELPSEPSQPTAEGFGLKLWVGSFGSWREVSAFVWEHFHEKIDTNDSLKAVTKRLIEGAGSWEEKVRAIHYFVSGFRYMGTDVASVFKKGPHPATKTLELGYGICRDVATLEVAMLREAGIEACVVGVDLTARLDLSPPTLEIQHAVTGIRQPDGSYMLLDPTLGTQGELGETYASGLCVLPIVEGGSDLVRMPTVESERNGGFFSVTARIDSLGRLDARAKTRWRGLAQMLARDRCISRPGRAYVTSWQRVISAYTPGCVVDSLEFPDPTDLSVPFRVSFHFHAPRFCVHLGDYELVPWPGLGLLRRGRPFSGIDLVAAREERKAPIFEPLFCASVLEDTLLLPEGWEVIAVPDPVEVEGEGLRLEATFEGEGRRAVARVRIAREHIWMPPEAASVMKRIVRAFARIAATGVLVRRSGPRPVEEPAVQVAAERTGKPVYDPAAWDLPLEGDWRSLLQRVPEAEDFPDASVYVLKDVTEVVVHPDGSSQRTRHLLVEILTRDGRERFSNYRIAYNPATQSLDVLWARTVLADGTPLEPDSSGVIDRVAPSVAGNPKGYDSLRQRVLCLPQVEEGVGIDICYRKQVDDPDVAGFSWTWKPGKKNPAAERCLIVKVPVELDLDYEISRLDPQVSVEEDGEQRVYVFRLIDDPGMPPEPGIASFEWGGAVRLSTVHSWAEAAAPALRRYSAALADTAGFAGLAGSIVPEGAGLEETVEAIGAYVGRHIERIDDPHPPTAWSMKGAGQVLETSSGSAAEIQVLTVALLRAAGLRAAPAVAPSIWDPAPRLPVFSGFPVLFVGVHLPDGRWWIRGLPSKGSTGAQVPFWVAEGVLLLGEDGPMLLGADRVRMDRTHEAESRLAGEILESGLLDAHLEIEARGRPASRGRAWMQHTKASERLPGMIEQMRKAFPGLSLAHLEYSDPFSPQDPFHLGLDLQAPEAAVGLGEFYLLRIPPPAWWRLYPGLDLSLAERSTAAAVECASRGIWDVSLRMPPSWRVEYVPEGFSDSGGFWRLECGCEVEGGVIHWGEVREIRTEGVPPEDYGRLRRAFEHLKSRGSRTLLLRQVGS